jgi:hypothetical protein
VSDERRGASRAPIFLVGLPRSGSTLWLRILEQHPELIGFREMHFLTPFRKDFRTFLRRETRSVSNDADVRQLVRAMLNPDDRSSLHRGRFFWKQIGSLGEDLEERLYRRIRDSDRRIGTIFRAVIDEATLASGASRGVVKFPVHPIYLPTLVRWYPEAEILHVTRDPRAVVVSKASDPGGTARISARYPRAAGLVRQFGKAHAIAQLLAVARVHQRFRASPHYVLRRYEDLVDDPERVLRALCLRFDLKFSGEMLRPHAAQRSSITGQAYASIDPLGANLWRAAISQREARFLGSILGPSMRRLGYDTR